MQLLILYYHGNPNKVANLTDHVLKILSYQCCPNIKLGQPVLKNVFRKMM